MAHHLDQAISDQQPKFLFRVHSPKASQSDRSENHIGSSCDEPSHPGISFLAQKYDGRYNSQASELPPLYHPNEPSSAELFSAETVSYHDIATHLDWTQRSSSSFISASSSFVWAIWESVRRFRTNVKHRVEIAIIDWDRIRERTVVVAPFLRKVAQPAHHPDHKKWLRFAEDSQSCLIHSYVPSDAVITSISLLELLPHIPSYFFASPEAAIPDLEYFTVFPGASEATTTPLSPALLRQLPPVFLDGKKVSFKSFMADISSRFSSLPVEERLRECTVGSVEVALWVLEELVEKVISDSPPSSHEADVADTETEGDAASEEDDLETHSSLGPLDEIIAQVSQLAIQISSWSSPLASHLRSPSLPATPGLALQFPSDDISPNDVSTTFSHLSFKAIRRMVRILLENMRDRELETAVHKQEISRLEGLVEEMEGIVAEYKRLLLISQNQHQHYRPSKVIFPAPSFPSFPSNPSRPNSPVPHHPRFATPSRRRSRTTSLMSMAMSDTDVESDVDIDGMPYSPSLTAVCHSPPGSPFTLAKGIKMAIPILDLDRDHDSDADMSVQGMDKGIIEDEPEEDAPAEATNGAEREEGTSAKQDERAEDVHDKEEKVVEKGVGDDLDNADVRLVSLSEAAVSRDDLPVNQDSDAAGDGDAEDVVDSGYASLSSSTNTFSSVKFQLNQSRLWNKRRGALSNLPFVPSEPEACSSTTADGIQELASLEEPIHETIANEETSVPQEIPHGPSPPYSEYPLDSEPLSSQVFVSVFGDPTLMSCAVTGFLIGAFVALVIMGPGTRGPRPLLVAM